MSRSIRKETSSLAFGMVGRFGGSSAGFVVTSLNAASAASREVVVLRVLSAGIYVLALGRTFQTQTGWPYLCMRSAPRSALMVVVKVFGQLLSQHFISLALMTEY